MILAGGPYTIGKRPIILCEWTPNFDLKEHVLRLMPLWVRFVNLPLCF